jgi:hypothetical protein
MATAGPRPVPAVDYEQLSELYLMLWRQLDNCAEENKWLQIRPEDASTLLEQTRAAIETIAPDPSTVLFSDYQRTQKLLLSGPRLNTTEVAAFREYLRDNALRYAQMGDQLLNEAADESA